MAAERGWLVEHRGPEGEPSLSVGKDERGYRLRSHGIADFVVARDGSLLATEPVDDVDAGVVREAYAQRVEPMLHQLRGAPALHGSALLTPAGVVAFVGPSGAGKSTLAALLATRWRVVADDQVPVRLHGGAAWVTPTSRALRLREEAADHLGANHERIGGKRLLARDAAEELAPLAALYVLRAESPVVMSGPLRRQEAVLTLAGHLHRLDPFAPEMLERELQFLEALSDHVTMRWLHHPRRFDVAEEVASLVLNDVRSRP